VRSRSPQKELFLGTHAGRVLQTWIEQRPAAQPFAQRFAFEQSGDEE
jgi:hypothetical protein